LFHQKRIVMKNKYGDGYCIFVMIQLAIAHKVISSELEYDLMWAEGLRLYEEFFQSVYNDENKSEIDCINEYLNVLKTGSTFGTWQKAEIA
jgi:hypothetical protein